MIRLEKQDSDQEVLLDKVWLTFINNLLGGVVKVTVQE